MKHVYVLSVICLLLLGVFSSTLTYEDEDLETLATQILESDFSTTPDAVESLVTFVEVSMAHSIFTPADFLLLFCQVGPKFYAHRQEFNDIFKLAELAVSVVLKAKKFPRNLELLQLIVFASRKERLNGYSKVVAGMFEALNAKEKIIFLDSVADNATLGKFVLPQRMFAKNATQFRSFISKYFKNLSRLLSEAVESDTSQLLGFDAIILIIGLELLESIGEDLDIEFGVCRFFLGVQMGSIPSRTRSQFLKILAGWARSCKAQVLENFHNYLTYFDLDLLSEVDYKAYAIIARSNPNIPRNEAVSQVITDHQRKVDAIFKVFEPIKFNFADQSLESVSSVDKRMRILANWENGLEVLNCQETNQIFDLLIKPILEVCRLDYGQEKILFVRRIEFYALVFITRLHPAPSYPVHLAFALLDSLELVAALSAVEYYEKNALMIVPKVLNLIMNSKVYFKITAEKIRLTMSMATRYAPDQLSEIAQYLIQMPELPLLSAVTILSALEDVQKLSSVIIMSGLMARFGLLMDGVDVEVNSALILEIFVFGYYNEVFSSTEFDFVIYLAHQFMDSRFLSSLRNIII